MRLFELLLLLSNIGLFALTVLLKKGRRRIPVFVASGIATLLLDPEFSYFSHIA
ncbi:hypothetical protein MF622_09640 [Paenibacillus polymyxa]|nr:hypothetical protein [Paenibacillus polymyxa]WDZ55840.1 hypothetical protein MF622_09640 [Paenibacillus polymyxa]